MKVLAVDTSTLTGSVALLEDENLLGESVLNVSTQHAERLLPAIDRLIQETRSSLHEIELLAVSVGPGSFTGLRIGTAAIQGLAASLKRPAVGISSLQTLALAGSSFSGTIVPLLDARRGEVYIAAYRIVDRVPQSVLSERVVAVSELAGLLEGLPGPLLLLGDGASIYRESLRNIQYSTIPLILGATPRASAVGWLAFIQKKGGAEMEPPVPRYLRLAV